MKRIADRHDLVCLLHEKPFAGVNGSGKHINWSLQTAEGTNLFEPGKSPSENAVFLLFLCAVIRAVDSMPIFSESPLLLPVTIIVSEAVKHRLPYSLFQSATIYMKFSVLSKKTVRAIINLQASSKSVLMHFPIFLATQRTETEPLRLPLPATNSNSEWSVPLSPPQALLPCSTPL